ncbi:amidoligase family protein [Halarcobacter sp.]|uniref:amidoligase family protein n=1 Tax=Halarcobacter sp. TaxID=2321133 RepID=UPI002AA8FCA1|nr:amidoligase family protein [Halarcobacter sp.]
MNYEQKNIIEEKYLSKLFYTKDNKNRHVGVEIEYSNLDLKKSAQLAQEIFKGEIVEKTKYEISLKDTDYGDFKFELDAQLLQKMQDDNLFEKLGNIIGKISNDLDNFVDKTSKNFVPFEIAMPPIPISDFGKVDKLVQKLRLNGALGTTYSFQYAFGVHLNIEPPSQDIDDVLRLFKSFLILQKWIEVQSEVDIARKISPFINNFSKEYISLVIDIEYWPTKEQFIKDYIDYNPTRNRVLDMLPIIAFWDEDIINKYLPKEKINKRPTFHYRLPNSKVDQFRWFISQELQLWVIVELLASNDEVFNQMSKSFLKQLDNAIFNKNEWIEKCHQCIINHLL